MIDLSPGDILSSRDRWIAGYGFAPRAMEIGKVVSVGDGIVWVEGLPSAGLDEVLDMETGGHGLVFHLTEKLIGAILFEQSAALTAGKGVRHAARRLKIKVGDALLGRVIDPMGAPLDGGPAPACEDENEIDIKSPPITDRDFVNRPLLTGNKILDTLIPIGKGQRQLLIGDNGLGKSSLAIDVVANQTGKDVLCVYVLIGQKRSSVLNTVQMLKDAGALAHTVIMVAEATALPGMQYLAPFAGCAVAEHWMRQGRDTLIVYDDLTAHADSYRELSLLLRRPPGREAYPADIFFLHSRLLERSTCLSPEKGGGSMTALPIIETKEGELASYIPTNLVSITDGQIYFDSHLYSAGSLPAIDVTQSVSRVGGAAQPPEIKREAGRMKLDYLQYLELEVFTRFGAKLEAGIQKKINRGRVLREILKQGRLSPVTVEQQMAWLWAFNNGLLDGLLPDQTAARLESLFGWVRAKELKLSDPTAIWVRSLGEWGQAGPS